MGREVEMPIGWTHYTHSIPFEITVWWLGALGDLK